MMAKVESGQNRVIDAVTQLPPDITIIYGEWVENGQGDRPHIPNKPQTHDAQALWFQLREQLVAEGHTPLAIKVMESRVRSFLNFLDDRGLDVSQVDETACWAYQRMLLEKPNSHHADGRRVSKSSVEALMFGAKRFLTWLVQRGVLLVNPMDDLEIVSRPKQPLGGIYTEAEMERFLSVLEDWNQAGALDAQASHYRTHVMAEVQYATGLRVTELCSLVEADLDLDRGIVWVRQGKGQKSRIAYLTQYAVQVLRVYLTMRPLVLRGGSYASDRIFGAQPANVATVYNSQLQEAATKAGLPGWYNHKFRHALGYHLLRAGCSIRYIQAILGHEKLSTTEIYTKVDTADVRSVLDRFHPLGHDNLAVAGGAP
jgi:site-specific recombinase XerD